MPQILGHKCARLAAFLCLCVSAMAQVQVTQSLSATFNPAAKVSVPANLTLAKADRIFGPFTGTLTVSYRARTVTGGTMTLKVTTDFVAGGPSAAAGDLQYACGAASLGTACSGTITASTGSSTAVLTLPAAACTGASCGNADPNSLTLSFTLADRPAAKTGSYTAIVQFTISGT
jgi:hypothetical protein